MIEGFSAEAMKCFVFVYNLTPSKRLNLRTPWEVFTDKPKSSLPPFYFGERVLYRLPPVKREGKLDIPC